MKDYYQCLCLLQTTMVPQVLTLTDKPDIQGLERFAAFKDGFWINEDLELCLPDAGKYWIPPSQILIIKRIELPPEEDQQ